jgi:TonB family protein
MAPRALLLSPDDQAVSAITGVLEELSVNCERPLDGASAAQKLNSQTFDLVLVDCDNLPAAKLIFDVCRRSHAGVSVPIAIVDGRAGLPTAFRLGAELILTKPVSKDQARTTIRTAVSRLKKEEPNRAPKAAEMAAPVVTEPETENRALAASASAAPAPARPAEFPSTSPMAAPVVTPTAIGPTIVASAAETDALWEAPKPNAINSKPAPRPEKQPSDDPVLAELEKAEKDLEEPIFTAYEESRRSSGGRGILIALLVIAVLAGGLYAAWMYVPQFRERVQPYIQQANSLMGTKAPANPSVTAHVTPSTPAPLAMPPTNQPSTGAVTSQNTTGPVATTPSSNTESNSAPTAASTAPTTDAQPKLTASPEKEATAEEPIILSSKGAERRLIHQVAPAVPASLRSQKAEGTVVLKTFVNAEGAVDSVQLVEGNAALSEAAIAAVKQWRYRPYVRDGKTKPFQTIVLVDFQ